MRVSLKNTFLSFDECGVLGNDGSGAFASHSPNMRSKSVDSPKQVASPMRRPSVCASPSQIDRLNQILDSGSNPMSPAKSPPFSGACSPTERSIRASTAEGSGAAAVRAGSSAQSACEGDGPTPQDLRQLQRRLEEMCQSRLASAAVRAPDEFRDPSLGLPKLPQSYSNCSVSTMGGISEDGDDAQLPSLCLARMPHVWSSNSVSTLASNFTDGDADEEGTVEFDLTIEDDGPPHLQPGANNGGVGSQASSKRRQKSCRQSSPGARAQRGDRRPSDQASSDRRQLPKEYRHGHVPRSVNLQEEYANNPTANSGPITTLMIRNLPNRYTQRELITELEGLGFTGAFDFLYIPLDKGTMSNVGYAFVNFVEPSWAEKCMQVFQNYRFKRHRKVSGKIAAVSPAHIQGLEGNLKHYENAAVNTAKLKQRRPVVMANILHNVSLADALGLDDVISIPPHPSPRRCQQSPAGQPLTPTCAAPGDDV